MKQQHREHKAWSVKWRWREAGFRKKEAARAAQKEIRAGSKRGWRSYTGPQQLLLHGDERGNRSWERGGSVKIWECSGAGMSAVQRQAAQGLGRICEAGTATHWGRNEREPRVSQPRAGNWGPCDGNASLGGSESKAAKSAFESISNLPELPRLEPQREFVSKRNIRIISPGNFKKYI